ncbi:exonuclease SbcCD subunit D [Clostridium swellfunianum]|uniref:exonuclease SbcCD subunit D n=1 Tax=Clostridium swellfunianum TaxID=1367462 RepID=UPI00203000AA|nr:exonuclease SbcCD subunit D [Clostridium swellfunianum]MCM0649746.1 exonuclease SbcCD subunit D [Clostridium swellfunianum]
MKIIHTGDWHIGKIVNEFSMIEDQRYILEQLLNIIKEERPNALVIAGDLYDRSIPPVEAIELLDEIFSKILLEYNTPILAIAGNHDSAERLSFGSRIFTSNGLHIAGVFDKDTKKVVLEDEYGQVCFYLVPYEDPKSVRHIYEDDEIVCHDDAMKKIVEKINASRSDAERSILVAHGYVTFMKEAEVEIDQEGTRAGLDISDSERPLSIGGTDLISGKHFEGFSYTALGHLHGPQKVGSDRIRYSGSLLKYSFSETKHRKGVTIVEIDKAGEMSVNHRELTPRRDMRLIKGPLAELISKEVYSKENVEDYIYAILTDEEELIDPISKLRAVYPNIMGLHREDKAVRENVKTSASIGYKDKSKLELFEEFYNSISGKDLTEEKLGLLKNVIEDVEKNFR